MNTSALHPEPRSVRHREPRSRLRTAWRFFPALLLVLGLGLLPAGAAQAGGLPSPHELHHDVRDAVSDLFRTLSHVPLSLHYQTRNFDVFYQGDEYYGPHRHNHATYRFPVWVDNDVHYRPYSYCNGQLYGHNSSRPRLWVEWGSLHSGHWCDQCHGYFPAAHGHFRTHPRYRSQRYRYERYDRHRYDRYRHRNVHRHDRYCGHRPADRHRYDRYRHRDVHRHNSSCGHSRTDRHRGHDRYDRQDRRDRQDRGDRRGRGRGRRGGGD